MASENPQMAAAAADLGRLLSSTPNLVDYSFSSDDMVARAAQYSVAQGPIPDLGWSILSPPLPMDCRIGEPCVLEMAVTIGTSFAPMNSSEPHPTHPMRHSSATSSVSSVTD